MNTAPQCEYQLTAVSELGHRLANLLDYDTVVLVLLERTNNILKFVVLVQVLPV